MRYCLLLAALLSAAACNGDFDALPAPRSLGSPAGATAGEPNLHALRDGRVLLNWTESTGTGHALRFAILDGENWSEPRTVATGSNWFVNWADFPSVIELGDGSFAAHWLVRRDGGRYAYDVAIARSADGVTWSEPVTPHDDMTPTEHGFVSLFPLHDDLGAVWLDGRNFADLDTADHGGHEGAADMTLRYARLAHNGAIHDEAVLDARTCECCPTTAAVTADGPIVAYRDRSPDEIRDISIVRLENGTWSRPSTLHADGWRIPGCPVNGPFAVASGHDVAIAWFTGADDEARVLAAFSHDAARSFGTPVRIDDGDPLGRVAAALLDDGSLVVSWLERTPDAAEIRIRRIAPSGIRSIATTVALTGAERGSGFPRMVRSGDRLVFAWTVPGELRRVDTAVIPLR